MAVRTNPPVENQEVLHEEYHLMWFSWLPQDLLKYREILVSLPYPFLPVILIRILFRISVQRNCLSSSGNFSHGLRLSKGTCSDNAFRIFFLRLIIFLEPNRQGLIAPFPKVKDASGITNSSLKERTSPNPSQVEQAPLDGSTKNVLGLI